MKRPFFIIHEKDSQYHSHKGNSGQKHNEIAFHAQWDGYHIDITHIGKDAEKQGPAHIAGRKIK